MAFTSEAKFEEAMIRALVKHGWEEDVLHRPTEEDLINNWADILFENNRGIDQLNGVPLSQTEMEQILDQVRDLRTPLKLNGFINGKTVSITRDNPKDTLHLGKEVSLKIYDRHEIAAGQSRYQIAQQPIFKARSAMQHDRRGDLMLLINGMPVFHLELKKSSVPVSEACYQIQKYAHEGVYSGIFALIQIFVACTPEETLYYANPGPDGTFNQHFYFHWADFNNEPINDWAEIASHLLSIPMAHQLIGFYTVADDADGVLKVMRSYQYYAAREISDRVQKQKDWEQGSQLGGYIWHTTGSGKTMTSFKSAQLIANSKDADKVVFLMDRIELGTQSLSEYRAFADETEEVQATENTRALITKLRSPNPGDTLIVTSIQKMSRIRTDEDGLNAEDLEVIGNKRVVFIVDECHRSTFGNMLADIKEAFPHALFFGFTGTPIHEENQKNQSTTPMVFGNELHRYSIADGIRDRNVLGFDPYRIDTFGSALRQQVALSQANATSIDEALADPEKAEIYRRLSDPDQTPDATIIRADGTKVKGIEEWVPAGQYNNPKHREAVCKDTLRHWDSLSRGGQFHAILATASIEEAIEYYRLFKSMVSKSEQVPELKFTALFDPNIDNFEGAAFKEDGLIEILEDYNQLYAQNFSLVTHAAFKKDVAARLAHKQPYRRIETHSPEKMDLLIVVDQMLTGFDSKWINTLYLDKVIRYENIIQAFSRTNRLYGADKPFGTIRYYRYPATMQQNIEKAVSLYSGNRPLGLFVNKLDENLERLNQGFSEIKQVFEDEGLSDFSSLPEDTTACAKFAKLFKKYNQTLQACQTQGFNWSRVADEDKTSLVLNREENQEQISELPVPLAFNYQDYQALLMRYKELGNSRENSTGEAERARFDIDPDIMTIKTDRIDSEYMDSRFKKFLKVLSLQGENAAETQQLLSELHRTFSKLSQSDQRIAQLVIDDILSGNFEIDAETPRSFADCLAEYHSNEDANNFHQMIEKLGVSETALANLLDAHVTQKTINEYGRFDKLKQSVDRDKAREFFTRLEGKAPSVFQLNMKIERLLQDFVLQGGFSLEDYGTLSD